MNLLRTTIVTSCLAAMALTAGCSPAGDRTPRLSVTLPFGAADPVGEPQTDGTLKMTGWVLSDDPVQTVSLYIDRRYVTSARLQEPRPDVNRAYPAYGPVNAGWEIEFDTSLFRGAHEIVVQARTVHDAVRELYASRRQFPN